MSENKQQSNPEPPPVSAQPDAPPAPFPLATPQNSDTMPREAEKQKIVRQLYNLIDRVDKL